jgi:tRNA dimethylallyltransferase
MAVDLAWKFGGEVVSADSRQVYKYMDVGTGKDLLEYNLQFPISNFKSISNFQFPISKSRDKIIVKIPYHLIDVVRPNTLYDLAKWLKAAKISIKDIADRERLPIVAGGTGLYAQALVDGFDLSKQGVDQGLRKELEKKTVSELYSLLDKKFAEKLNNSDKNNKRRLIRYIEIEQQGVLLKNNNLKKHSEYEFLLIGLTWTREVLYERIDTRLKTRLEKEKMLEEVADLHENKKVSWKRLESFGLEYKYIALYLQKKLEYAEMAEKINIASRQYAKRQMSWLRRWEKLGAKIHWVKNAKEAEILVKKFTCS